ncbi:unnamed protein product [Caenorhabditis auriculariae]|uniref:IBR domain-containing protein n=1 Tax=Caenorhabditis auriculariae TaxID=2777116 RepID=A0A8S1H8M4_9PELO|nr:unnamed protein product [Caenorhabditis auriculariae]
MASTAVEPQTYEEFLLEKYKGTRRWLGKPWDGHQDDLAKQMKTQQFVQKKLQNDGIVLSKKEIARLAENDELQFNVVYSMNKKNRWEQTDPVNLMKEVSAKADVAVVERNFVSFFENEDKEESTAFAVHSRTDYDVDDESFGIRTAKCAGKGQKVSNFAPEARELSEKKDKKKPKKEEKMAKKPTVVYNIVRTHPVKEIATAGLSNAKSGSKAKGRTRGRPANIKNIQDYVGNDEDYSDEEDVEDSEYSYNHDANVNFADYLIEKEKVHRKPTEMEEFSNFPDGEEVEETSEFEPIVDLSEVLSEDHVYTVKPYEFVKENMFNFEAEVEKLQSEEDIQVRSVGNRCILVDASNLVQKKPNSTLFIVFRMVGRRCLSVAVNASFKALENTVQKIHSAINTQKSMVEMVYDIGRVVKGLPIKGLQTHPVTKTVQNLAGFDSSHLVPQLYSTATAQKREEIVPFIQNNYLVSETDKLEPKRFSSTRKCESCKTGDWKELYDLKDGSSSCLNCLRHSIYRQLRQEIFPVTVNLAQNEGDSELDALAVILPITVFSWYTKRLFENIYTSFGTAGKFFDCFNCSALLYLEKEDSTEETKCGVKCGFCHQVRCEKCSGEVHWPMNCGEYSEWKPKWDVQYIIQTIEDQSDSYLLELECNFCKVKFEKTMPVSELKCPECKQELLETDIERINLIYGDVRHLNKTRDGESRNLIRQMIPYQYIKLYTMAYRTLTLEMMKQRFGTRVRKEVADICLEARKQRLSTRFQLDLLNQLKNFKKVDPKIEELPKLFNMALFLVENVMGWVYVQRKSSGSASAICLKALKIVKNTAQQLSSNTDLAQTIQAVENLEKIVTELISFVKTVRVEREV